MSIMLPYRGTLPNVAPSAFVAPNATLIGDVVIGEQASIWFGAVLRGDVMPIRIGARSSIQDNATVHATAGWAATLVGEDCVVGHAVILHGCSVADRVLVGMGAVLLDGAEIGSDTILGAGCLVPPNAKIPSGVLAVGQPARVKRDLNEADLASIRAGVEAYLAHGAEYLEIVGESRAR